MNHLTLISSSDIEQLLNHRPGETKLGQTIHLLHPNNWQQQLKTIPAQFILLGIPEDIGVRANHGTGGTHTLWQPALKAILNVQHTDTLHGNNLAILGVFNFSHLMHRAQTMDILSLREAVNEIDNIVYPIIKTICEAGKTPIIIGGGHNNAYPILKGISRAKQKPINTINLDAHTDYRAIEGRHSGNGFRYAKMDGYLKKYAVIGLHRNYNSQQVITEMTSDPHIHLCFYEDIFIEEKTDFTNAITTALKFTAGEATGIELDLDCIERTLSSAATPCGITPLHARQFIARATHFADAAYLHIAEGCTKTNHGQEDTHTAKLAAYLVTDFIRAATNKPTVFLS